MMKKKVNILLMAVVLGLWGTVMYRYVNRFFYSEQAPVLRELAMEGTLPEKMKKDTFELQPLSHDPFLNRHTPKPITRPRSTVPRIAAAKPKPQPVRQQTFTPFPVVKYFGFIKSKDKKEELILLKINNSLHKTHLNGNCEGVVVKKIYKDSVQVVFGKEARIIRK